MPSMEILVFGVSDATVYKWKTKFGARSRFSLALSASSIVGRSASLRSMALAFGACLSCCGVRAKLSYSPRIVV